MPLDTVVSHRKENYLIFFSIDYYYYYCVFIEPFSNYKFPGEHELYLYACNTNDDCGKKKNVICADSTQNSNYKVCQCQEGSLLDPNSQTCGKEKFI